MSWRDGANSVVHRVTGYTFTRETPEQRRRALQMASEHGADRAVRHLAEEHRRELHQLKERHAEQRATRQAERRRKQSERAARAKTQQAEQKAMRIAAAEAARHERDAQKRVQMVTRFDEELYTTVQRVGPRTMTSPSKVAALIEATRYVSRARIPGAVVECGVWRGGSMEAVALTLLALGDTDRELHLFDTYEGMPPPTPDDTRTTASGTFSAEQLLAASAKDSRMWAVAGLDDVKQVMAGTGYPTDKVHFHVGLIEDTTPSHAPETIAILRLDTDWYASTKHELVHLYHRLSPGGVLVLDDYGDWDGARKATDEWLAETGTPIFLAPMGSGRIAVKPQVEQP